MCTLNPSNVSPGQRLAQTWFSKIELLVTDTIIFSKQDHVSIISRQGGPLIAQRSGRLDVKLDITRYRHISGTTTYSSFEDGKAWVDPIIGARTVWTFPGGKRSMHKGFEDPAAFTGREDEKIAIFRRVRDEIREWIVESFGGERGERKVKMIQDILLFLRLFDPGILHEKGEKSVSLLSTS